MPYPQSFRHKFYVPVFNRLDGRLRELVHLYEPLRFYHRLDGGFAAVMRSDVMLVFFYFYQVSLFFQIFYDGFSRLIALHALISAAVFIDRGVIVHHIDHWKVMSSSHFKIIWIMGRCDLHGTGSKLLIYIFVRHDRDLSVTERKL